MSKAVWSVGGLWSLTSTGTLVKRGLEFTAISSELSPLVVFTIPNFNARALVAAGPASLYPRDSILCL